MPQGGRRGSHAGHAAGPQGRPRNKAQLTSQLTQTLPELDVEATRAQLGTPVITFDHVSKVYPAQPNKPALADISLQIYAGEFLFLVGHSGSGKSTFIKLLTREIRPTQGHIYVADEDLTTMRNWRVPYLRRNIGCVFQDFKLLPSKTVFENVAFALEVIGKSKHGPSCTGPRCSSATSLPGPWTPRPPAASWISWSASIARAPRCSWPPMTGRW